MPAWDDLIPDDDLKMFAKAEMGGTAGRGNRPAILVIDMTYGFVDDAYPLGSSKMGWPAIHAIKTLLEKGRQTRTPIFFTKGKHPSTIAERGRWKHPSSLETGVADPKVFEIVQEIQPRPDELVITKLFPSAFFGTNLVSMLLVNNIDTIIVTGMTTSGCVRATAVDGFSYNFWVTIPEECVADRGVLSHKVSLFDMHMKYADVSTLSDVIRYLESIPKKA